MSQELLILYGSQTGSAEALARMMAMAAITHGFTAQVSTLNGATDKLKADRAATLVIVSTYGTGEFPSNAEQFAKDVEHADSATVKALVKFPVAIFGLGNSTNDNFCAAAKKVEAAAKAAGATFLLPTKFSCERAAGGHEPAFRQFRHDLWAALGVDKASGVAVTYEVTPAAAAAGADVVPSGFGEYLVNDNTLLTPAGYAPAHRHLTVSVAVDAQKAALKGRAAAHTDHVQVLPKNPEAAVTAVLARLGFNGTDAVTVKPLAGAVPSYVDNATVTVAQLFRSVLDLRCLPSRATLEALALLATADGDRAALEEIANNMGADSPYDKKASGFWSIVDALREFPSVRLTLAQCLTHLPRIQPRTYSISNDPGDAGTDALELTFVVSTKLVGAATHDGLATGYLNGLKAGDKLTVRVVEGTLDAIPVAKDLCLLALGTGIAPIRAVMQRRARAKAAGEKVGEGMLFYGYRHTGKNDLYVKEFQAWQEKGLLQKVVGVASHDTSVFRTPLDVMDESVKTFLGTEGHFLYCGIGGAIPFLVENGVRKTGADVGVLRLQKRYHEEYFTQDSDIENLFKDHVGVGGATLTSRFSQAEMFCFQCEQTFGNKGCAKVGVCGKTPRVAALQDLTVQAVKVLSFYAHRLRQLGEPENAKANHLTLSALFTTLTNVNNDEERFVHLLEVLRRVTEEMQHAYAAACAKAGKTPDVCESVMLPTTLPKDATKLVEMGKLVGVLSQFSEPAHQSVAGVCEMLTYSCKGISAYADHSLMNHKEDPAIYAFLHEAMAFLLTPERRDLNAALGLLIKSGSVNVATMALLDSSNKTLGTPGPSTVPVKPKPGKCILISGHDLILLNSLLPICDDHGINVYTHGEMLPAHSYPALKGHKSLAGHYGGAWMRQSVEFPHFPGPVLMTTNCITEPHDSYKSHLFTCAAVGWPGVPHLGNDVESVHWQPLIDRAKLMKGFTAADKEFKYADPVGCPRPASLTVGFGHDTILSVAPTVLEEVTKGNITRFFVVGGCDGFEGTRSYYTEFVKRLPKTAVVLTVGCGKFRFNHLDLGTIGETGIPRILDMGQCNDSFGAVQVALGLAGALKCEVKDLPLSIVLSWFEQKAIAVLLSLMALGIKPIHVGPSLPAFITPEVLGVLVKDFGIKVCGDPQKDVDEMCAATAAA